MGGLARPLPGEVPSSFASLPSVPPSIPPPSRLLSTSVGCRQVIHAAAIRTSKHCLAHQRRYYGEDRIHPSRAVDFASIYYVKLLKDAALAMPQGSSTQIPRHHQPSAAEAQSAQLPAPWSHLQPPSSSIPKDIAHPENGADVGWISEVSYAPWLRKHAAAAAAVNPALLSDTRSSLSGAPNEPCSAPHLAVCGHSRVSVAAHHDDGEIWMRRFSDSAGEDGGGLACAV
ncbi:hypothetical protein HYPSUDRAFT_208196 [Hypholoma sublateritium FD-334 SS-4]|uniref:Uncharacterized protein n=1 Tax=Hypholoma sublateritium (strain FD-334 SS-4) TaxID=945553 RepID=A0A0D2N7H1_HYPSF|nr:hypothetical protein HYPSUDRAFT_208196 [Hypholoma sublateritium FD-334 SS-4]